MIVIQRIIIKKKMLVACGCGGFNALKANFHNVRVQDCHIIGIADMNIPKTKSKENVQAICRCLAFLNDLGVNNNVSILEMPDIARDSCKRGLADEESAIQQCLWSLQQYCDSRYVVNFDTVESKCTFRTASPGVAIFLAHQILTDVFLDLDQA